MGSTAGKKPRPISAFRLVIAAASGVSGLAAVSPAALAGWGVSSWSQDGQASYYGRHWTGRRTSSGAVFDPAKLTAAHASLPLGTRLLVTCENSGASVVVTVNDREPEHGHRIIDLSPAAARRLGMLGWGVADVVITPATTTDIASQANRAGSDEADQEVADAPDEATDQEVATPRSVPHVSRGRHGRPRRHLARR